MEGSAAAAASPEPLLRQPSAEQARPNRLAVLLGRAAGRRGPSMLVRERAALQLEERRADWGYSRPVVAVDIVWNIAFALASVVVLSSTVHERTNVPIRLWVAGYAVQCVVHVVLVWMEYRRRNSPGRGGGDAERVGMESDGNDSEAEGGEAGGDPAERFNCRPHIAKRCESLNTMASFIWWVVGFYWVVSGGEFLLQNAPRLYWLAVVFLAFDVFFAIFCVALACIIGIALCCCLPCIIAILYAIAGQEGASDADISILPRYKFQEAAGNEHKISAGGTMIPVGNSSDDMINERTLLEEDAECCICLTPYENGVDLNGLPCNHHFHSTCIVKWLRINATCPLCKYNVLKGNERV